MQVKSGSTVPRKNFTSIRIHYCEKEREVRKGGGNERRGKKKRVRERKGEVMIRGKKGNRR